MANPLDGFTVVPDDLWFVGENLNRPASILAEPDGGLWVSDGRGGGTLAPVFSSLTFAGPDRRTVLIGSHRGTRLPALRSPVAGLPLGHWS